VAFDALAKREFKGTISQIVPQSVGGTHTVPVRVDVENLVENGRPVIAAGLFARVLLPVGDEHPAVLVPKAAVIRQSGQDLAYTLTDQKPASVLKAEQQEMEKAKAAGVDTSKPPAQLGPAPQPTKYAVAIPVKIVQGHLDLMEVQSDKLKAGTPLVVRGTYLLSQDTAVRVYAKEGGEPAPAARKTGAAE
jgi:multidrug efflux pump subunit AcrA (membrane-fusion protein)